MSIAPKPLLAGGLLIGVIAVWTPRLTGFDPFGLLPEAPPPSRPELPRSTAAGSEGSASGPSEPRDELARTLETALRFLSERGTTPPPAEVRVEVPSGALEGDERSEPEVRTPTPLVPEEEASPFGRLLAYLERHPLHTVALGGGMASATFGLQRTEVGDALTEEGLVVAAIDRHGVVLDTPDGRLRVHLPDRGSGQRVTVESASAGEER